MMNKELKTIFSTETDPAEDDILYSVDPEVRQKMYDDTLNFFVKLYGEDVQTETTDTQNVSEDTASGENTEEYTEDYTE